MLYFGLPDIFSVFLSVVFPITRQVIHRHYDGHRLLPDWLFPCISDRMDISGIQGKEETIHGRQL